MQVYEGLFYIFLHFAVHRTIRKFRIVANHPIFPDSCPDTQEFRTTQYLSKT